MNWSEFYRIHLTRWSEICKILLEQRYVIYEISYNIQKKINKFLTFWIATIQQQWVRKYTEVLIEFYKIELLCVGGQFAQTIYIRPICEISKLIFMVGILKSR